MALTFTKARIAAVLELPPSKPSFSGPAVSRSEKLRALLAFREEQKRWRRIGDVLTQANAHMTFRTIDNGPAAPGQKHGTGTLQTPKGAAVIGRVTDCTIVHTAPNRAQRRAAGGKRVRALREQMLQSMYADEARANIARGYRVHGRWRPFEGSIGSIGALDIGDMGGLAA